MVKSAPNVITSLVYNKYWEKAIPKTGFPYNFTLFHGAGAHALIDDLIPDVLGDLDIVAGLHGVLAAALGAGAQISGVAEHLAQRHEGVDLLGAGAGLKALDLAAAAVQVADDVAHILLGDNDAHLHDGLQQGGIG